MTAVLAATLSRSVATRACQASIAYMPRSMIRGFPFRCLASGTTQRMEFKAETKKLLDIVAKSIYTESEVFIRELLSNCSDALEKQRFRELKGDSPASQEPLHISITTNEKERTLTIFDSGIGMSKADLIQNLGTIAYSGSAKFLEQANKSGNSQLDSLIGQFGVGFYSTFIVSEYVEVVSKNENSVAAKWTSDGSGTFDIQDLADPGFKRGTKITLKLKNSCRQFSKEREVESIIKKYSLFISHPIKLNGDLVNNLQAIWYRNRSEVSSDEYQRFFEHITGTKTPYKYLLHYSSDVPLSIKAMLYIPNTHTERMGIGQEPCQISLYSRKILIKQNMEQLLPKYLRFVKGVVDCEDLPLNLSRETYQGSAHIEKLKTTIAKRVIKMLEDEMKKDPAGYTLWYRDFQQFIKEGLAMDQDNGEALLRLVRFPSSLSESTITLDDYLNKLGKDENKIYYFFAPKRDMAMGSPYLEPFKSTGVPVLFTEYHLDEMCLRNIGKYKDHEFTNIESSYEDILADFEKRYPEKMRGKKVEPMPEQDVTPFCLWIKNELGANVQQVTASRRYSEAPGLIVGQVSSSMRQIMAMFDPENRINKANDLHIEINVAHSLIKKINRLRKTDSELAGLLARSLLDYLMIVGAVPFDVNSSCKRSLKLIERTADVRLGDKTGEEAKKPEGGNRFERPGQHRKQSVMREAHDAVKGVDHRKPVQEFVINAKGEPVPVNKKSDK